MTAKTSMLLTILFSNIIPCRRLFINMNHLSKPDRLSESWRAVRKQFNLSPDLVHLAPMLFASHPKPVRQSIASYRKALDRNPKRAHDDLEQNDTRVLCAASAYLGVSPNLIALTDSTTMGLGLICTGLGLDNGDQILHSEHGHYSSNAAIGYAIQRVGATRVRLTLYDPDKPSTIAKDAIVNHFLDGITDATRLVVLTWVHSSTGVKIPVRKIARAVRELNTRRDITRKILLAVDGVHALGVEDFELNENFCDFFIAGCHKTLCGPRGTGIIWGTQAAWQQVQRTIPPFGKDAIDCSRNHDKHDGNAIGRLMTPGGYHSYESRWALADAFNFQLRIGKRRIKKRLHRLANDCKQHLEQMPHVQLVTPLSQKLSSAIVCFNIRDWEPKDLEVYLESKGVIASASKTEEPCIRFSVGLYTRRRDLRAGLKIIRELG